MDFTRAEDLINTGLEAKYFSGAALGIYVKGEAEYAKYFGKLDFSENAKAVDETTLFDLASLTKIVSTTIICLRLVDQGRLRLSNTVGDFFPEATAVKDVSIYNLLTHTSGEESYFQFADELEDKSGIRDLLLHRDLKYKTGSKVEYSCIGFILLGEILKKVTNKSLDTLFNEEVAAVLGLENSGFRPDPKTHNIAKTKDESTGKLLEGIVHDENARFQAGVSANSGLFANLNDLMVYAKTLLNQGITADKKCLISPVLLKQAVKNYTPGLGEDRGLGFQLLSTRTSLGDSYSEKAFGHTGFTGTSIVIDPVYETVIVLLTNRVLGENKNSNFNNLRSYIHSSIMAEISYKQALLNV